HAAGDQFADGAAEQPVEQAGRAARGDVLVNAEDVDLGVHVGDAAGDHHQLEAGSSAAGRRQPPHRPGGAPPPPRGGAGLGGATASGGGAGAGGAVGIPPAAAVVTGDSIVSRMSRCSRSVIPSPRRPPNGSTARRSLSPAAAVTAARGGLHSLASAVVLPSVRRSPTARAT